MKRSFYECDICGEEMYNRPDNDIKWKHSTRHWWDYETDSWHLCNECVKKFKEFIKSYDLPQREQDN